MADPHDVGDVYPLRDVRTDYRYRLGDQRHPHRRPGRPPTRRHDRQPGHRGAHQAIGPPRVLSIPGKVRCRQRDSVFAGIRRYSPDVHPSIPQRTRAQAAKIGAVWAEPSSGSSRLKEGPTMRRGGGLSARSSDILRGTLAVVAATTTALGLGLVGSAAGASSPPPPGPYLAQAEHYSSEIAARIGHPLLLSLSVVVNANGHQGRWQERAGLCGGGERQRARRERHRHALRDPPQPGRLQPEEHRRLRRDARP